MRDAARTLAVGATWALAAAVVSVAAGLAVNAIYAALGADIPEPAWLQRLFNSEATPEQLVFKASLLMASTLVASPVIEEILFRGLLQGWLMRELRPAAAVALTALAFAAIHGSVHDFAPLLCVSACLSAARDRGGLLASIAAHSLYNAMALTATLAVRV